MKRLPVRSLLWATRSPWRPAATHAAHSPTTTSGSRFVGHAGFTQISYARWRNGCTFTRGAWHTGHTPFSPSMACTRPLGTG